MKRMIAMMLLAAVTSTTANAQQSVPACAAPEFRQLDFWVGEWDVTWQASPGQAAGAGVNIVTKQFEDCVIQEDFSGGPTTGNLIGRSVSTYDANAGGWRQTWVDNQGGYFALVGGAEGQRFVLESTRLNDAAPYQRMVFEDITPTQFTWRWQRRPHANADWADAWVIQYARRSN